MSRFPNLVPISLMLFTLAVPIPIFPTLIVSLPLLFQCLSVFPALIFPISFLLSLISHFPKSVPVTSILSFTPTVRFPIFPSTISLLFRFQFLYELVSHFPSSVLSITLMSYTPTVKFPIFFLLVSLLLLFQFSSFLSFVSEFAYHPHRSTLSSPNSFFCFTFRLPYFRFVFLSSFGYPVPPVSIPRQRIFLVIFSLDLGSARGRHLIDRTQNLVLPICRQFSLLPI